MYKKVKKPKKKKTSKWFRWPILSTTNCVFLFLSRSHSPHPRGGHFFSRPQSSSRDELESESDSIESIYKQLSAPNVRIRWRSPFRFEFLNSFVVHVKDSLRVMFVIVNLLRGISTLFAAIRNPLVNKFVAELLE